MAESNPDVERPVEGPSKDKIDSTEITDNDSPASPDPLNTAFSNVIDLIEQSQRSLSSSQQSRQITTETSTTIHGLIETIVQSEQETIALGAPAAMTTTTATQEIIDLTTPSPSSNTIDLCTPTAAPTVQVIDLCTPTGQIIDLCTPESPSHSTPK